MNENGAVGQRVHRAHCLNVLHCQRHRRRLFLSFLSLCVRFVAAASVVAESAGFETDHWVDDFLRATERNEERAALPDEKLS